MRLFAVLCVVWWPWAVVADSIVADLSQARLAITAGFDGSEIIIFGAIDTDDDDPRPVDVIVAVSGPTAPVTVRKKDRVAGIWINTTSTELQLAPALYKVATTGPLGEILSEAEDQRYRISTARAILSTGGPEELPFKEALIRIRQNNGLYALSEGAVDVQRGQLFRTTMALPANLVEGDYTARVFLTREQEVVASYASTLDVRKVGLERWIYNLAHERPLIYGLLSLAIAIAAGWSASAVFRYFRG